MLSYLILFINFDFTLIIRNIYKTVMKLIVISTLLSLSFVAFSDAGMLCCYSLYLS